MSYQFAYLVIFILQTLVPLDPILILTLLPKLFMLLSTLDLTTVTQKLFRLSDKSRKRLGKVQITAVRIVTLCKKNDHVTPYLKEFHWLPIHLRINFKILLITYKILNDPAPAYLSTLVKVYILPRKHHSRSKDLLQPVRSHSLNYGDCAFSIAAPHLWNNLLVDIRTLKNCICFKN